MLINKDELRKKSTLAGLAKILEGRWEIPTRGNVNCWMLRVSRRLKERCFQMMT